MKISKRLDSIASLIPDESRVIDVGCDHALLDIYLSLEKNCECIASDINQSALDQAKYNILRFHAKNVSTMLTDGLDGIPFQSKDIVVISGMGTATIKDILKERELPDRMVISTHTDYEELRRYIVSLGYQIQNEIYVEEKKKSYVIIDFIKGNSSYTEEDYQFGPILKMNDQYLQKECDKMLEIMKNIPEDDPEMENKKQIFHQLETLKKHLVD